MAAFGASIQFNSSIFGSIRSISFVYNTSSGLKVRDYTMYFQKRGGRYSFVFYDPVRKQNVRLKRSETPHIQNDEEAQTFCDQWNQQNKTAKDTADERRFERAKISRDLNEILAHLRENRKEEAPNISKSDDYFLNYYILPFFVDRHRRMDPTIWPKLFEDFRQHLRVVSPVRRLKTDTLSYSTKNNIIKVLNALMITLYRLRRTDTIYRCRQFSSRYMPLKDETSVIPKPFQHVIQSHLQTKDPTAADLFLVSLHTGMRTNELLGLSLGDLFTEAPFASARTIHALLRPHNLTPYGFVCIDSQPALSSIRSRSGVVPRKPLKNKKAIGPSAARIIPIFDRNAFNTLVRRWNQQRDLYQSHKYGLNAKDYLLFEGITRNKYASLLRSSQKDLKHSRAFTPHDTRHTYSTWLAEKTGGNFAICRLVLGHSKMDVTLRYVHMNERLQQGLQTQQQLSLPMQEIKSKKEDLSSNVIQLRPLGERDE